MKGIDTCLKYQQTDMVQLCRNGVSPLKGIDTLLQKKALFVCPACRNGRSPLKGIDTLNSPPFSVNCFFVEMDVAR